MYLLDLAHWSLIAALKDQGTLSRAAASIGVTQSAATQRLREAERRIGVPLARKQGRTLVLTEAGQTIADAARATLPTFQQAESDAIWQGKRHSNQLTLAMSHFDPPDLSLRLVELCKTALPGVSIELMRVTGEELMTAISAGTADLALLPGEPAHSGVASRAVAADRLVAVFPIGDGPEPGTTVHPDNFAGKSFLTYDLRPEPGWEYDRFFDRGRSFPGNAVKIESTELICRLVSEGEGASILPGLCVALSAHSSNLTVAELDADPILFNWNLLHAPSVPEGLLDRISNTLKRWTRTI